MLASSTATVQAGRVANPRDPVKLKAAKRRYYLKYREKILARVAEYRATNPEKVRESQRKAVEANREYYRQWQAQYNRANSAKRVAYAKAWAAANPERANELATAKCLKRRSEHGYLSANEIRAVRRMGDGLCSYCLQPKSRLEIDHVVPLARGGANALENCVTACRSCNARKQAKTPLEFLLCR